jgi:hypothetical protein
MTGNPSDTLPKPDDDEKKVSGVPNATAAAKQATTGVNPGGTGYVSGQANPNPGPTPEQQKAAADSARIKQAGQKFGQGLTKAMGGPPTPMDTAIGAFGFGAKAPKSEYQTTTSNLGGSLGAFADSAANPAPAAPAGPPGSTNAGSSGTTQGTGILDSMGPAGSAISSVPVVGGILGGLTSPQVADLTPVHNAQNADFQQAQNLNQERYDYRPGEAPSQLGVKVDTTQTNDTRAKQEQALAALTDAAAGTTPSAAELMARKQAGAASAAALGAARALGGRSAGGVARIGAQTAGDILAKSNADTALMRADEQAKARNELDQSLQALRGQDQIQAQQQAALDQAKNQNNLNSQIQTDQNTLAWRKALLDSQLEAMGQGTNAAVGGVQAAKDAAAAENKMKGGILSGIGSAIGL